MDGQRNITVRIAGREYRLMVKSADEEELYRNAADLVNRKLASYQKKFLGKPEGDILSFVAFNVCLTNLRAGLEFKRIEEETGELHRQLEGYLADMEQK